MSRSMILTTCAVLYLATPAPARAEQALGREPPWPRCELTEQDYRTAAAAVDSDGDGVSNLDDVCPTVADPEQLDSDGDRVGDLCDACPQQPAPGWTDGCPGDLWD